MLIGILIGLFIGVLLMWLPLSFFAMCIAAHSHRELPWGLKLACYPMLCVYDIRNVYRLPMDLLGIGNQKAIT